MQILMLSAYIYLGIGTVYALYLLFSGNSSIFALPINILGGPINLVLVLKETLKKVRDFKK